MEQYKFQKLVVYRLALDYVNEVYAMSNKLPDCEKFNLKTQMERAATSIALNIAEGSTGQSDAEQARFVGLALRSYIETVACFDLIQHRGYVTEADLLRVRMQGHALFVKIQALRRSLSVASRSSVPGLRSRQ